jgi:hypothetical protein
MNIRFLGSCCAATLALVGSSSGQSIIFDNFDGYADQAAFEAVWAPIGTGTPSSALLSTEQALSLSNSIKIPGNTTATAALTQSRNRRTFTESGAATLFNPIVFSIDFYDVTGTGNPQRNYANLQDTAAPGAANQLISLGLNNSQVGTDSGGNFYMARILGYTTVTVDPDGGPNETVVGAGAYFKLNDFGVGLRSAGWHNLRVVISTDDGVSTDYAFYVDNVLAEFVSNVGASGTLRSYDNIALGSGLSNGNTAAYIDNVSLSVVPEPASFALFGLGCAALSARRRRASAA